MEKERAHIDELIAKYLAGEATQEETHQVHSWREKSVLNRQYMAQFEVIFKGASAAKDLQVFDTDAAWRKVKASLKDDRRVIPMPVSRPNRALYWQVAAGFLITLLAGVYLFNRNVTPARDDVFSSNSHPVADTLPDGSQIYLNKQTTLQYAFDKKSNERRVSLKGEAFFTVEHDDKKPFVVDVDGVLIRDIGTAFNVKAEEGSTTIEVVVNEGEVMFYTAEDSGLYLRAGARGVYDKVRKQFTVEQPDPNALAYKTGVFNFNNLELAAVVRQLNRVYSQPIELSPGLEACRLTVAFKHSSQDEVVAVIAETLGLTVREGDGRILLEGTGCAP